MPPPSRGRPMVGRVKGPEPIGTRAPGLGDRGTTRYKRHVIRVFLLDDHEVVCRGIADLLAEEPDIEVVGESGSAVEATHRIPALRPDVAILDGRVPDGSGIEVC